MLKQWILMTYAHFAADFWTWVTDMSENVAQTNKWINSICYINSYFLHFFLQPEECAVPM